MHKTDVKEDAGKQAQLLLQHILPPRVNYSLHGSAESSRPVGRQSLPHDVHQSGSHQASPVHVLHGVTLAG